MRVAITTGACTLVGIVATLTGCSSSEAESLDATQGMAALEEEPRAAILDLPSEPDEPPPLPADLASASTVVRDVEHHVLGQLRAELVEDGVHLVGKLAGLEPNRALRLKFHENRECGPGITRFEDAGSPYMSDGAPQVLADGDGVAMIDVVAPGMSLGGEEGIGHRTVIIHGDLPVACGAFGDDPLSR